MDDPPAAHALALEVELRSEQIEAPSDHLAANRPPAVAQQRRDVEGRLADDRLGVDREPRLPPRPQHVAALEILVTEH